MLIQKRYEKENHAYSFKNHYNLDLSWSQNGIITSIFFYPCLKGFIVNNAMMYQFICNHLLTSICFALEVPQKFLLFFSLFFFSFLSSILTNIKRKLFGFPQKTYFIFTAFKNLSSRKGTLRSTICVRHWLSFNRAFRWLFLLVFE